MILVANKKDLRDDPETIEDLRKAGGKPITEEEVHSLMTRNNNKLFDLFGFQGKKLMEQIKALKYFEVSAKTGEGITELFQVAAKLSLKPRARFQKCKTL